jgi:hypothetical protein
VNDPEAEKEAATVSVAPGQLLNILGVGFGLTGAIVRARMRHPKALPLDSGPLNGLE